MDLKLKTRLLNGQDIKLENLKRRQGKVRARDPTLEVLPEPSCTRLIGIQVHAISHEFRSYQ